MSLAVQQMFDRISAHYDFLNRFLSLRRDVAWRRRASLAAGPGRDVLDLCGGTGDFLAAYQKQWGSVSGLVGDFSLGMLRIARRKWPEGVSLQLDALHLPFSDDSFDVVLCGFGLRNLDSLDAGLAEIRRVLRPGGRLVALEFFRPTTWVSRFFYQVIAPVAIPLVGALFSGRRSAYEYLVRSVQRFVSASGFKDVARKHGLEEQTTVALDFGIAYFSVMVKENSRA
ncbi:MAG TPA: ubiquinone/menaquinone biosynthesis methyltransferase [Fibrobacteraceae bacterium]|nr:ubiquinone/menaquinone biosynthesis methyltransferase [Fibrobacteraceae bacterium]